MREVLGVSAPPRTGPARIMVRWPKPGEPMDVTLLGERPTGVMIHWVQVSLPEGVRGYSRICSLDDSCVYCRDGIATRHELYLACWSHDEHRVIVLAMSADGWAALCRAVIHQDRPLRGVRMLVSRANASPRSPLAFTPQVQPWNWGDVPPEPDIRPVLRSIFGGALPVGRLLPEVGDETGGVS